MNGTVDAYSVYRKKRPSITFVVHRKVVAPVMFRNSETDRAETQEFSDSIHAQVNPEKFISQERVRGLHLLRYLSEEFGPDEEWSDEELPDALINDAYTYNEDGSLLEMLNLDTLTYGVAGTGDDTFSMKSHVVQGYSYSMDEYNIVNSEVRNAVYESGTMRDEEGNQSSSLFEIVPVRPDNSFVSFVTIEAGVPEMVLYTLHNILNTETYGARGTRNGKNIDNEILAVISSPHPQSLSSGELIMDHHTPGDDPVESVNEYLDSVSDDSWSVYSGVYDEYEDEPDWMAEYRSLCRFSDEEALYEQLLEATQDAYETLVLDTE